MDKTDDSSDGKFELKADGDVEQDAQQCNAKRDDRIIAHCIGQLSTHDIPVLVEIGKLRSLNLQSCLFSERSLPIPAEDCFGKRYSKSLLYSFWHLIERMVLFFHAHTQLNTQLVWTAELAHLRRRCWSLLMQESIVSCNAVICRLVFPGHLQTASNPGEVHAEDRIALFDEEEGSTP